MYVLLVGVGRSACLGSAGELLARRSRRSQPTPRATARRPRDLDARQGRHGEGRHQPDARAFRDARHRRGRAGRRAGCGPPAGHARRPRHLDAPDHPADTRLQRAGDPVRRAAGRAGRLGGVYITYAAHVAAMAPNTNIGSATPVAMGEDGEQQMSPEMRAKVTNDATAYIRRWPSSAGATPTGPRRPSARAPT